jgi:hypothetical protein
MCAYLPTKAQSLPSGPLWLLSKRRGSAYRSGRSPNWLKMKNPACTAGKREEEEDWVGEEDWER